MRSSILVEVAKTGRVGLARRSDSRKKVPIPIGNYLRRNGKHWSHACRQLTCLLPLAGFRPSLLAVSLE